MTKCVSSSSDSNWKNNLIMMNDKLSNHSIEIGSKGGRFIKIDDKHYSLNVFYKLMKNICTKHTKGSQQLTAEEKLAGQALLTKLKDFNVTGQNLLKNKVDKQPKTKFIQQKLTALRSFVGKLLFNRSKAIHKLNTLFVIVDSKAILPKETVNQSPLQAQAQAQAQSPSQAPAQASVQPPPSSPSQVQVQPPAQVQSQETQKESQPKSDKEELSGKGDENCQTDNQESTLASDQHDSQIEPTSETSDAAQTSQEDQVVQTDDSTQSDQQPTPALATTDSPANPLLLAPVKDAQEASNEDIAPDKEIDANMFAVSGFGSHSIEAINQQKVNMNTLNFWKQVLKTLTVEQLDLLTQETAKDLVLHWHSLAAPLAGLLENNAEVLKAIIDRLQKIAGVSVQVAQKTPLPVADNLTTLRVQGRVCSKEMINAVPVNERASAFWISALNALSSLETLDILTPEKKAELYSQKALLEPKLKVLLREQSKVDELFDKLKPVPTPAPESIPLVTKSDTVIEPKKSIDYEKSDQVQTLDDEEVLAWIKSGENLYTLSLLSEEQVKKINFDKIHILTQDMVDNIFDQGKRYHLIQKKYFEILYGYLNTLQLAGLSDDIISSVRIDMNQSFSVKLANALYLNKKLNRLTKEQIEAILKIEQFILDQKDVLVSEKLIEKLKKLLSEMSDKSASS